MQPGSSECIYMRSELEPAAWWCIYWWRGVEACAGDVYMGKHEAVHG
jgi:hypothetical protein